MTDILLSLGVFALVMCGCAVLVEAATIAREAWAFRQARRRRERQWLEYMKQQQR